MADNKAEHMTDVQEDKKGYDSDESGYSTTHSQEEPKPRPVRPDNRPPHPLDEPIARLTKQLDALSNQAQAILSQQPLTTQRKLSKATGRIFERYSKHGVSARLAVNYRDFLAGTGEMGRVVADRELELREERPVKSTWPPEPAVDTDGEDEDEDEEGGPIYISDDEADDGEEYDEDGDIIENAFQKYEDIKPRVGDNGEIEEEGEDYGEHGNLRQQQLARLEGESEGEDSEKEDDRDGDHDVDHDDIDSTHSQASEDNSMNESASDTRNKNRDKGKGKAKAKAKNLPSHLTFPDNMNFDECLNDLLEGIDHWAPPPIMDEESRCLVDPDNGGLPFHPVDTELEFNHNLAEIPPDLLSTFDRIYGLHAIEAKALLKHHIAKYGVHPVFRVGVRELVRSQLEYFMTSASDHDTGLSADTRTFLRSVFEQHSGELNIAEKRMLLRVTRCTERQLEIFWEDLWIRRRGYYAMRAFIAARELEMGRVDKNKRMGEKVEEERRLMEERLGDGSVDRAMAMAMEMEWEGD